MTNVTISDAIRYIGCDDHDLDLFESQYIVPNGISYNSYVIMDQKIAIMDTADERVTDQWFANLEEALEGREPDYLVVSHMEPDHASNIVRVCERYPGLQVVTTAAATRMISQFFDVDLSDRLQAVKEGDQLELGDHCLTFMMAPMVHWPEVMVEYESKEGVLFTADAFGKFGCLDVDEEWDCEARRYYVNICGKYGPQVQALMKKVRTLEVKTICPLHGPILKEDLDHYLDKYDIWSKYEVEDEGVAIVYGSIHGNTGKAAKKMAEIMEEKGQLVEIFDLSRDDMAEAVENSFRYDKLIVACPTYDAGLFPPMEDFLYHLKMKNFQKRKVAIMENGSWAPMAGKLMRAKLEECKDCQIMDQVITIRSAMKPADVDQMKKLAEDMLA